MSDAALETLSVWLIAPAVVVLMILGVISYSISPRRAKPGRRNKQIQRLRSEFEAMAEKQGAPHLNWLDYNELTKAELKDCAAEYSWRYVDQDIRSTGWLLQFKPSRDVMDHENRTS